MQSFKTRQAKYSRKIHAAIDSVANERWAALRDTAIEIAAGAAAIAELVGEFVGHLVAVRHATRAARA